MSSYVRLSQHGPEVLREALTWEGVNPFGRDPSGMRASSEVRRVLDSVWDDHAHNGIGSFDVVLRLPIFDRLDRLQQLPPRWMAGSLTWVATKTYAGSIDLDGARHGMDELRRLLRLAARDLRDPNTKPIAPGQDPISYPRE